MKDNRIKEIIKKEEQRQNEFVELIASENFVSQDVLEAAGSVLTNKYAEGYPGLRYYGGCEFVDEVEQIAIDRIKKAFEANYANVQPHSGSQSNQAVYTALLEVGDKILGMSLSSGGHLTHGHFVNVSGKFYKAVQYDVNPKTEQIDFDDIRKIALKEKPKMIITGYSAYSRKIDFAKFREIADEVGAILLADVAHIAGLIVTGEHPNPMQYAHVVTSTTHKTLRGPRGGIILTNDKEIAEKINKAVFPGIQGGPLMHIIAAKAVAFGEILKPEFKNYIKQVKMNASYMVECFLKNGVRIISGGTDNHVFLIDVKSSFGINGDRAEKLLQKANIILNKNMIPFDKESPFVTSGVRIGTPAMTTKGWKESEFAEISKIIIDILKQNSDDFAISKAEKVKQLLK